MVPVGDVVTVLGFICEGDTGPGVLLRNRVHALGSAVGTAGAVSLETVAKTVGFTETSGCVPSEVSEDVHVLFTFLVLSLKLI